jgi:hypothetical protein
MSFSPHMLITAQYRAENLKRLQVHAEKTLQSGLFVTVATIS